MKVHNNKRYFDRRKELRKSATPEELILWGELRNNKLGYRFRRQHSLGGYIVDLYCFKARLIVEIDGDIHAFSQEYDRIRDSYFQDLGYKILRIRNKEIHNSLPRVLNRIKEALSLRLGEGSEAGEVS